MLVPVAVAGSVFEGISVSVNGWLSGTVAVAGWVVTAAPLHPAIINNKKHIEITRKSFAI